MRQGLCVKLNKNVNTIKLIRDTENTIKKMLNTDEFPRVKMVEYCDGSYEEIDIKEIGLMTDNVSFNIEKTDNIVVVFFIEIPLHEPFVMEDDAGIFAAISGWGRNKPWEDLLITAISISLARECNVTIDDDDVNWTRKLKITADELENRFTLPEMNATLEEKVIAFGKLLACQKTRIEE